MQNVSIDLTTYVHFPSFEWMFSLHVAGCKQHGDYLLRLTLHLFLTSKLNMQCVSCKFEWFGITLLLTSWY